MKYLFQLSIYAASRSSVKLLVVKVEKAVFESEFFEPIMFKVGRRPQYGVVKLRKEGADRDLEDASM